MKVTLVVALLVICGNGIAKAATVSDEPQSWWPTQPPWWPTNWPWPSQPTTTPLPTTTEEVTTTTEEPITTTTEVPCEEYQKYPCPFNCNKFFICLNQKLYLQDCNKDLHFNAVIEDCDLPERANCVASTTTVPPTTTTEEEVTTTVAPEEPETTTTEEVVTTTQEVTEEPVTTTTEEPVTTTTEEITTTTTTPPTTTPPTTTETTTPTTPSTPPTVTTPSAGICPPGSGHVYVPHPTDCTKFYQCNHGISYLHTCPASLHFDPKIWVCNWPNMAGCTAK